jgi:hypothetical protein
MTTKEDILNWNHEDIHDLKDMLDELEKSFELPAKIDQIIDFSDLPSEYIPSRLTHYPIWSMDKRGYCLVGAGADSIEHIDEIRSHYGWPKCHSINDWSLG